METLDYKKLQDEEAIEFEFFRNQDAYHLGSYISEEAIRNNYPIIIRIEKNNDLIYQYANDNTSSDNSWWIEKKINVVKKFNKSSAFIFEKFKSRNKRFEDIYINDNTCILAPGAVPIKVKNVGVIGVIAISGLDSVNDHQLIIKGLNHLLEEQKNKSKEKNSIKDRKGE